MFIHDQLLEYGDSHQNKINKIIHWFAVPAIYWSIIAGLWSINSLIGLTASALSVIIYFSWSRSLSVGMFLFNALIIASLYWYESCCSFPLWKISFFIFVFSWVVQFFGHWIEGVRPSFLSDVRFLLVGPAWIMAFIYRALKIRF